MSSEFGAFIFSYLDDYGLDPYEFRLYARIQRRAGGQGKCYESLESMAKGCLMNIKTARRALQSLVKFNMVGRQDVPGSPTRFWLNPQQLWSDGPTPTKLGGGIDSECDNKEGDIDGPTPTKLGRGTKSGRGVDSSECPNLGPTPTKSGRTPLPNQVGEGIPSKIKKLINQETPCIPLLEPAASTPEEETHTERCAGQEEEKAKEEDSSQSSSALVKVQEEPVSESEESTPGQIVPAAGQAASATKRERKYDSALGMCPPGERKKRRPDTPNVASLFPEGPWLTDGVQVNAKFLAWKANQFMKSAAFAGKSLAVVEGDVLCRWTKPFGEGAKNIFIDWTTYAKESCIHADSVQMRLDAGISITEAEQEEIVGKLPAITSTLEPIAENPNTPAILPQEAAQISSSVQSSFTLPQPALEVKIEASAPAISTVTLAGVENEGAYKVFTAAQMDEEYGPPSEEVRNRIAQLQKSMAMRKFPGAKEPETEFDKLKIIVACEVSRKDPLNIARVKAAEERGDIEAAWHEDGHPTSIWQPLNF